MKYKKKVIYFSYEYYCHYGARTHARSFFKALSEHSLVSDATIFPTCNPEKTETNININSVFRKPFTLTNLILVPLKKILKLIIPKFIKVQIKYICPSFEIYRAFVSEVEKQKPDVLVLRIGNKFRYIKLLRRKFPHIKICIEFNSTDFDEIRDRILGRDYWRHEEARQLSYADSICTVSQYLRNYLISLNPSLASKTFVNHNGVDPNIFKPANIIMGSNIRIKMGIPSDAVVFGYIGGMESFRQLPRVVAQFAGMKRTGMDRIFLLLIGTGQDIDEVLHIIEKESVDLTNWVYCSQTWIKHEQVPAYISVFDVAIFPYSNPYGSPQKIFEYLSSAIPVIGPDVPAVTEIFDENILPFLIKQDGSNFEQVFKYVYENYKECKELAHRGRDLVQREYTWQANASRTLRSLE